jgi:formate dehydrogenase subunit beta
MSDVSTLRATAKALLEAGDVGCVIGYEVGPRGRTRPTFVTDPDDVDRLVWDQTCTHNLARYLPGRLTRGKPGQDPLRVGVVVKPCDSRAIHVQLAESQYGRDQVHVIGVVCDGIIEGAGTLSGDALQDASRGLQARCQRCQERAPFLADIRIGEPPETVPAPPDEWGADLARLDGMTPAERAAFWLTEFDRCIRCYACRQACPMCNCPTCLYERDDSTWVGMGIRLDEKRAFHLGRAYHLAARCIGCDECERACPMDIPISLLNRVLARQVQSSFGFRPGLAPIPGPLVTVIGEGEVHG